MTRSYTADSIEPTIPELAEIIASGLMGDLKAKRIPKCSIDEVQEGYRRARAGAPTQWIRTRATDHADAAQVDQQDRVRRNTMSATVSLEDAQADREVERILKMTDEEIIAEVGGPEEAERIAEECRAMFEKIAREYGVGKKA